MIEIKNAEDEARISVACDLDDASLPQFESVLGEFTGADRRRIIVDLTQCGYITSSAVTALIEAQRRKPGRFDVLIAERGAVNRLFDICGFIERDILVRVVPSSAAP